MRTVLEVIKLSKEYLDERKISSSRLQAEELLAHVLGCKRLDLYLHFDRPLDETELAAFREKLKRRGSSEPLGYLFGSADFYGCTLEISRDVLIPRQESEILIAKVVEQLRAGDLSGKRAWDLCTGSGCLGIALKKNLPALDVTLSDLSKQALAIARKNAEMNAVALSCVEGDLLIPFRGQKADIVLCNPPYVSEGEFVTLEKEVRDFEPRGALVSGPLGFEFYARLAAELPSHLNPSAKIFFEIGSGQGERLLDLFSAPCWTKKRLEKDWAGHDRFFFLEFE